MQSAPLSQELPGVSIVIPTLNESANITILLLRLNTVMTQAAIPYEAIVIDDHSQDGTDKVARHLAQNMHLPVRVFTKHGHAGKAFSLMEGFSLAQYNILVALDGDLQYPPEAIPKMVGKLEHADIVVADRRDTYRASDRFRGALSGIFTLIINLLFHLDTDMQSGLKLFRRNIYEGMKMQPGKWSLDLYLVTQAIARGYTITNIPIVFEQRLAGKSKVMPLAVAAELLITALKLKLTATPSNLKGKESKVPRIQEGALEYIITVDVPLVEQVKYYTQWLDADTQGEYTVNSPQAIESYKELALQGTEVNGKAIATFAPFNQKLSALRTFTLPQILFLIAVTSLLSVGLLFFPTQITVTAIALLTFFYFSDLLINFLTAVRSLDAPSAEEIDDELVYALENANWPAYTVLCPLYREAAIVPQFVQSIQKLDYPTDKLQVLFLVEQDDVATKEAIQAMNLPGYFYIVTVPDGEPRTKPRACNYGLLQATGRYVVIYDAEDCPDPLQLKKAILTFANHAPDVACVQAKLNFYNVDQNILTRWFTAEYSLWFDLTLPGLQQAGFSLPLGGTSNHFRIELLRKLGAWDAFNVTEDCDLGLRLAHYKLKTLVLDSTTYEEATSQLKNWIRQRSRWIKGYMQTYLVYMRNPFRYLSPRHWKDFLSLQLVVGGKTAILFINPLMWLLLLTYILLRPFVAETYHTLFPAPILYMGAACLFFGNFFYIYTHLFGCVKRNKYSLVKWTLFIPVYWMLSSVAACVALFQLIFKPHYWEKTQHGFHLQQLSAITEERESDAPAIPSVPLLPPSSLSREKNTEPITAATQAFLSTHPVTPLRKKRLQRTFLVPFVLSDGQHIVKTVARSMKTAFAAPLPVIHRQKQSQRRLFPDDAWFIATFVIACISSIVALAFFFSHHQTLLYGDGYAHLLIARHLFDSATPGIAQLGAVWLPLPHLVMLPFIWNDTLWRTGLAGSIPSMICYVIASIYIFLFARRMTQDSRASFIGTLLFIVNPNILYLQTTPLSELVLISTLTMTGYYFLVWVQEEHASQLIKASAAAFLVTLARYDGWSLFFALALVVVIAGCLKRQRWVYIEGNLLVFCSLGGLGIGLWALWNAIIFGGDPLYFQRGPFSAQAQQADLLKHGVLFTYHNLQSSVYVYVLTLIKTIGPGLFILAALTLLIFLVKMRISPVSLVVLALMVPLVFYVYSLYSGQAALFLPGAVPAHSSMKLFNVRYGVEAVAPAAVLLAFLAHLFSGFKLKLSFLLQGILIAVILIQSVQVTTAGIITLQDGQYGTSCYPTHLIDLFLTQHYNGGRVLIDTYTSQDDALEPEAGILVKNIIYEGSTQLWSQALRNPAAFVNWIIVNPKNPNDLITQQIKQNPAFLSSYRRLLQEQNGLSLYLKNGTGSLPTRPLPDYILTEHSLCGSSPTTGKSSGSQLLQPFINKDLLVPMQKNEMEK